MNLSNKREKISISFLFFVISIAALLILPGLPFGKASRVTYASNQSISKQSVSINDLDAARIAALTSLYAQLKAGGAFSEEEAETLRKFDAGLSLTELEADTVTSRALYDYFIAGKRLTRNQQELLDQYSLFVSRREKGILDLKTRKLRERQEAVKNASPQAAQVAPTNDLCAGAEVIPAAGPFPYSTAVIADITDATTVGDPPLPSCQTNVSRSIWYTFTPSSTGTYVISTCADAPTGSTVDDTVMAIYTSSGGCAGVFSELPSSGATDGCDDDSCTSESLQSVISTQLNAGTTYYIVVWEFGTVAPTAGNTAIQLMVNTTSACTLTCPANISQPADSFQCSAGVNYPPPTFSGNCPVGLSATCTPPSGSTFPVGTTTVNCAINTGGGGSKVSGIPGGGCSTITHSSSQTITPLNSISCNDGFGNTETSYWRAFNLPTFSITNLFVVQSVSIGIESAISGGGGQRGRKASFLHNPKSAKTNVTSGAGQPLTIRLYTNTGGAFPDGIRNLLSTANFTITDQSGTIVTLPISAVVPAGAELVVEAFIPNGQIEGNLFFIGSNAAAETAPSYVSALECGFSTPTPTADIGAPNMHMVMNVNGCEATSASSCSFTVTINDTQAPTIICPEDFTQPTDPNQCSAVVQFTLPAVSTNCPCAAGGQKLQSPNGGSSCPVVCNPSSGSVFPLGTTTVNCTAMNASGVPASCSFAVTVVDTQVLSITCPANLSVSNTPNQCSAVANYPAPTVNDNCSVPGSAVCSPASGSLFPLGTTTITCNVTNNLGEKASCSFTLTVVDTQPPSILCPPNQTILPAKTCPAPTNSLLTYPAPTVSDNCSGVTVSCLPPSGSVINIGTTTVTCTATDASGNTSTCSFTVSLFNACVQDDANPARVLFWNTQTGDYRFCCNGSVFTGRGTVTERGCTYTLNQVAIDRRVSGKLDLATFKAEGSLQTPAGKLACSISDRDVRDNTCICQ